MTNKRNILEIIQSWFKNSLKLVKRFRVYWFIQLKVNSELKDQQVAPPTWSLFWCQTHSFVLTKTFSLSLFYWRPFIMPQMQIKKCPPIQLHYQCLIFEYCCCKFVQRFSVTLFMRKYHSCFKFLKHIDKKWLVNFVRL